MARMVPLIVAASLALSAGLALAQQPPGPPAPGAAPAPTGRGNGRGPAPLQTPNPRYVSIYMTTAVNAPVDRVWARVGKFCDIGEWLGRGGGCTILSGKEGQIGAVRSIGNEVMVGQTQYSYTYTQPVRTGVNYNLYHGTLEAVAVTPTTSRLNYTLMWDASGDADEAAVQADENGRRTQFTQALANMKTLAEGGTLPPPAPRGGGGSGGPIGAPPAGR